MVQLCSRADELYGLRMVAHNGGSIGVMALQLLLAAWPTRRNRSAGCSMSCLVPRPPTFLLLLPRSCCSSAARLGVPKRTAELAAQLDTRVASWGGDRPIHSVLVANNGLAATKFIRSIRSWAYKNFGNERAGELAAPGRALPDSWRGHCRS